MKNIKAIIFDMDGVLIDSELIWFRKYHQLLKNLAPDLSLSVHKNLLGRSIGGIFDYLHENHEGDLKIKDKNQFLNEYKKFGIENVYNQTNLLFNADLILNKLKENHLIALSSSSPWAWIDQTLRLHNLEKYFNIVVSGQDFEKAKPDPEIYFFTAQKLKQKNQNCLVIEDSTTGIEAGKRAGMKVLGLKNGFNEDQNLEEADEIINDLAEIIDLVM